MLGAMLDVAVQPDQSASAGKYKGRLASAAPGVCKVMLGVSLPQGWSPALSADIEHRGLMQNQKYKEGGTLVQKARLRRKSAEPAPLWPQSNRAAALALFE